MPKIVPPYTATPLDCMKHPYTSCLCDTGTLKARSIVITSGAKYRSLNLEDTHKFDNAGIYYATTPIQGEICRDKKIIFVSSDNSAGQTAVFLAKNAKYIHILIRGTSFSSTMSDYLVGRIDAGEKITLHTETEITK